MASLIISYFASVDKEVAGEPIKSETITTSGTSAASAAIPSNAVVFSLFSDAAHYVTFGEGTPTAAASNSFYVPANQLHWQRSFVSPGVARKIAAITA